MNHYDVIYGLTGHITLSLITGGFRTCLGIEIKRDETNGLNQGT